MKCMVVKRSKATKNITTGLAGIVIQCRKKSGVATKAGVATLTFLFAKRKIHAVVSSTIRTRTPVPSPSCLLRTRMKTRLTPD